MPPPSDLAAARKGANAKKGISGDDQRRRREESAVSLRKEKREEGLLNGLKLSSTTYQPVTCFQISAKGLKLARKVPMKFALPGASVAQRPFPSRMSSRRFVQPPLRLQCAEHFARCRQGTPGQRIQRAASNRLVCRAGCSARLCAAAGDEARCVLPISVRTCRSGGGVATRFMLQS